MHMKLMIIESPGKSKKLREIMARIRPSEDWRIEASVGHVRDLPANEATPNQITTGISADLMPIYQLTERGQEVIAKLKRSVANADEVYLAMDPDREGESIAWHLKEALGLRNPLRIAFNEITDTKVIDSLSTPGRINMKLVAAQEARRVLDRLVGYLASSELRRQTGEKLSAGRVQSPAVYLVVQRERQIRAFRVTEHFGALLIFAGAKTEATWKAAWLTQEGFTTEADPYFMDRAYAESVAGVRKAIVMSCEEVDKKRNPPAPFTTSTLQQAASNALRWDPDKTMKVAQQLYEQGHISYMRSDNPNVSEESMPEIRAVAAAMGLQAVEVRRKFKAKDGAQEGHPAVTPTHWEVEAAGETQEQHELYKLIRIRGLASQLLPALYKVRTVIMKGAEPVQGREVTFGASGRTLVDPGWLKLLSGDATDDEPEEEEENPIPMLEPGTVLDAESGEVLVKKTKSPPRYTPASLVKALEAEGVGRPSTYASIINNIMGRGYVAAEQRFLKPMPLGELVIEKLEGNYSFLDIGFTKDLEDDLDLIAQGDTQYRPVVEKMYSSLAGELKQQQGLVATFRKEVPVYDCPDCAKPMRRIKGPTGHFWGCTGHPECKCSLPDANGKPGVRKTVEVSDFKCGECGKPLVRRQKRKTKANAGYDFWGCTGFREGCKATYPNLKGNKPDYGKSK